MNDYERFRRFPHFGSIPHYSIAGGDRNAPLTISHANRADLRGCPVAPRSTSGRDLEAEPGGGQPRRRIAVAVGSTFLITLCESLMTSHLKTLLISLFRDRFPLSAMIMSNL